jgi:hypothetical protein
VDALVAELTSAFTHRDLDVADDTTSMGGASSLADTAAAGANGTSTFFLHARGLSKSPTVSSLTSTPIYEGCVAWVHGVWYDYQFVVWHPPPN